MNPKKSVTADYGKLFKSLKRHLMNKYGLTPQQYRQRRDLDPTYPMTAPNYAATRSKLAMQTGLGRRARTTGKVELQKLGRGWGITP